MKRFLSFLLVLAALFSLPLSGCGESKKDYEFAFRNGIQWGMSESEVLDLEGVGNRGLLLRDGKELSDGHYVRSLFINFVPYGKYEDSTLIYRFYDDSLIFAAYDISEKIDVNQVVREFNGEYGEEDPLSQFAKAEWFTYLFGNDFGGLAVTETMNNPGFEAVVKTIHHWVLPSGTEVLIGVDSLSGKLPASFICYWNQTFRTLMHSEFNHSSSRPTPSPQTTPSPQPRKNTGDSITLLYSGKHNAFSEKTYSFDEMRSEVNGTVGLLRNSSMDHYYSSCDMTTVYNAIDFMVIHGTNQAMLPLTKEQVETIQSLWINQGFFAKLYPMMEAVSVADNNDGTYTMSLSFSHKGNFDDEEMAYNVMIIRSAPIRVVENMPRSCNTDYKKAEYLYTYISQNVNYYDGENHDKWYWDTGFFISPLYDAFSKEETVCAGFAYSFAYLCELAGIDAQYVIVGNKSNRASHAVVIAELSGKNYWFDPTWDEDMSLRGFEWFGLSDAEFKKNHESPTTYYSRDLYPSCPSELPDPTGYWDIDMMKYREFGSGTAGKTEGGTIREGRYSISSALDKNRVLETCGYSMEEKGNVQIWKNGSIAFQQFDVTKDKDGGYVFRNVGSTLVLQVDLSGNSTNRNVWQRKYVGYIGHNYLKWSIISAGNEYFYIKSNHNFGKEGDLYLEVAGNSAGDGTNVQAAPFTGKDNQKWRLKLITPFK